MDAWESLAQTAALLNISIFAAAGDHGASDQIPTDTGFDGQRHADFPGTAPHIISCGGAHLETSGGTITSETVWNSRDGWASGGGVSAHFPRPSWQNALSAEPPTPLAMRGVPDVAGVADNTGTVFQMRVHGQDMPGAGTSAVAPMWAGLTARLNNALGKNVGFFLPALYASKACRDLVIGDNTTYKAPGFKAKVGWDACTGLGTPNGQLILGALAGAAPNLDSSSNTKADSTAKDRKKQ